MTAIKCYYLAGPFSATSQLDTYWNVIRLEFLAFRLLCDSKGAFDIQSPTGMSRNFHGLLTADYWYAATLRQQKRCDGLILGPNWRMSMGARGEHEFELKRGGPIYDLCWRSAWAREPASGDAFLADWYERNVMHLRYDELSVAIYTPEYLRLMEDHRGDS